MKHRSFTTAALAVTGCCLTCVNPADAESTRVVTFEGLGHGQIVANGSNDFNLLPGVTVEVDNYHSRNDLAVIFNSTRTGTADSDLEGPSWKGGNLAAGQTVLGNLLIIQETSGNSERNNGVFVDRPNDEGSRPAGHFLFKFDRTITSFGFDLVDVEGPSEYNQNSGFFATFTSGNEQRTVGFGDLVNPLSARYDATIDFGDNTANRVTPITAASLGLDGFDTVKINLGGSSGIDNLTYTAVPSPTALGGGLALIGGLLLRRRRRSQIEA